jgi:hypothetical protein
VLKSTVPDETLDDVFEEVLEVHRLRVDAYVPLARASRQIRGMWPARVVGPNKAGPVGIEVT